MADIVTRYEPAPPPPARGTTRPAGNLDANMRFRVRASTLQGQQKRGEVWSEADGQRTSSVWVLRCDEGPRTGGTDTAPSPLIYFSAAIAF